MGKIDAENSSVITYLLPSYIVALFIFHFVSRFGPPSV